MVATAMRPPAQFKQSLIKKYLRFGWADWEHTTDRVKMQRSAAVVRSLFTKVASVIADRKPVDLARKDPQVRNLDGVWDGNHKTRTMTIESAKAIESKCQ